MTRIMKLPLNNKVQAKFRKVIICLAFCLSFLFPINILANVFYSEGVIWISNSGVKAPGDATTANSYAQASSYRSNIAGQFSTDVSRIAFNVATGTNPAVYSWDLGSSDWPSAAQNGDIGMTVAETRNDLLGWTGDSWIGGKRHIITDIDLGNSMIDTDSQLVMEPIPTPVIDAAGTDDTQIKIKWTGLWDNDQGGSGGSSNNSVVSYSIYRSVNGGAYQAHGSPYATVAQNAGAEVSYTDTGVSLGNTYKYKITVNFDWTNHVPAYYETTAESPESAAMEATPPEPDRIAFSSTPKTITAGATSSVITIETREPGGSAAAVVSDTTIDLSSNSTSANEKFYSVSGGVCTATPITQVAVATGNTTAQFCYYDEAESSPTWTLTAHKSSPSEPAWTDGTQAVTVNADSTVASVRIDDTSGGGTEITTHTMTADDSFTMYAIGLDQYGNIIGDVSVTWSTSGLTPALSGTGTSKTFSPTTAPASGTVSIDDGATHTDSTGTITVNPGTAATFAVTAPATATAGTSFNLTSITAKDADGNTATSYSGAKTIVYSGPANGTESGTPTYTTSVDFTSGAATTTLATTLVAAETVRITATESSISGESGDIVVSGGTPTHLHVTAPATATAGTSFNLTAITAHDVYGNTAVGYSGAKTINYSGPANGPLGNVPTYTTAVDFTEGVSTTTLATTLVKRETAIITVNDGTYSGVSGNVAVGAGTAGSIEYVSGNNQTGIVSQELTDPLVVLVKDVYGNNKDGYTVQWAVLTGEGSVTPASSLTASDGTAQTSWQIGPYAGTHMNDAAAVGTGLAGSPVLFEASGTSGAVAALEVTAPATATAGVSFDVSLSALDTYGNIVASFVGEQTVSYSGPSTSPDGTLPSYTTTVTFAAGVATSIPTTLVKAETATITATVGAYTGDSLPIEVAEAETGGLEIISPTPQIVGVPFNLTSIRSIDAFGNHTSDYSGAKTLSYSGAGTGPAGETPSFTTAAVFADGAATTTLATTLVKPEIVTLNVTDGTFEGDSNPISVGYNEPYVLTYVSGNGQSGGLGVELANPLIVKVMNSSGLPVIGETVHFSASDGSLSATSAVVNANGFAQAYFTLGDEEGAYTVTATVTGIASVVTFTEEAVLTGASQLAFTTIAQEVAVNAASSVITVCLQDAYGNSVATGTDRVIALSSSSTTDTFASAAGGPWTLTSATLATGESCVNFYYKDPTAGVFTLTASTAGISSATQSVFVTDGTGDDDGDTVINNITNTTTETTEEGDDITTNKEYTTNEGDSYVIIINNYYGSGKEGEKAETNAIAVPEASFPVILSPREGSLVYAADGEIIVSGTALPDTVVTLDSDGNEILGSGTADGKGNWRIHVSAEKVSEDSLKVTAGIHATDLASSPVAFGVKKDSGWLGSMLKSLNLE